MPKAATTTLRLTAEIPPNVTLDEWMGYVRDEVMAGVGQRHPEDPLFHLDRASVQVRRHYTRKPAARAKGAAKAAPRHDEFWWVSIDGGAEEVVRYSIYAETWVYRCGKSEDWPGERCRPIRPAL